MLRVMTWNIDHGTYNHQNRLPRIAQILKESEANVVALQEAPKWNELKTVREALKMDWRFVAMKDDLSLAMLCAGQAIGGSTHNKTPGPRPMVHLTVPFNGGELDIFTVHLKHGRGQHAEDHRVREVEAILQKLKGFAGRPHILAGDFNALAHGDPVGAGDLNSEDANDPHPPHWVAEVSRSAICRLIDAGYIDCYRQLHTDAKANPGYTFSTTSPWLRFDYIFASHGFPFKLTSCEVIVTDEAKAASDHFPVVATFK